MYRRLSQLITETIEAYRAGRLSEAEYFNQMRDMLKQTQQSSDQSTPARLHHYQHAPAYFGLLQSILGPSLKSLEGVASEELLADMAIEVEKIIEQRKIRDWTANRDIHKSMMNDIEDYLYPLQTQYNFSITSIEMDLLLEQLLEVAKQRDRL